MRSIGLREAKTFSRLALLAALLGLAACAGLSKPPADATDPTVAVPASASVTPAPSTGPVAAPNDYRIGPGDLLKVEVFGAPDLNRSVRVNASGQISLPLIGAIKTGGLTAEQLAADIAARLAKDYLQNPQVTIFIEEFTSQRVTVTGAVKTPNVFPLKGKTTLLQVVSQAGGPTSVAGLGSVKVLRQEPGEMFFDHVSFEEEPDLDPREAEPGDQAQGSQFIQGFRRREAFEDLSLPDRDVFQVAVQAGADVPPEDFPAVGRDEGARDGGTSPPALPAAVKKIRRREIGRPG